MSSIEPIGNESTPRTDTIEGDTRRLTKKRRVIIIVVIIIILIPFLIDILNNEYEVDIQRTTDSAEEKEALQTVEGLDLEAYIDTPRYTSWRTDHDEPPDDIRAYVWANLLDEETLEYYRWKVDALKDDWADVKVTLRYKAECTKVNNTRVIVYYSTDGNTSIFDLRSDDANYSLSGRVGYIEKMTYDIGEFQYNFTPSYIVVQDFYYRENYGPLAAFFVHIDQIALLDEDMNLLAIVINTGHGVS